MMNLEEVQVAQDIISSVRIKESEQSRKEKPTKHDIWRTERILRDFGIKDITVPNFETRSELELWRRKVIKDNAWNDSI